MNTWQLCPKCQGTGQQMSFNTTNITSVCDLCSGAKIISTFTGLPPQGGIPTSNTKITVK